MAPLSLPGVVVVASASLSPAASSNLLLIGLNFQHWLEVHFRYVRLQLTAGSRAASTQICLHSRSHRLTLQDLEGRSDTLVLGSPGRQRSRTLVRFYSHLYIHMYIHVHICICNMCTCICIYKHTFTYVYIYIYVRIYIHIYSTCFETSIGTSTEGPAAGPGL